MAQAVTERTRNLADAPNKTPVLVFTIDGIPFTFGSSHVGSIPKYGEEYIYGEEGLRYGQVAIRADSRDIIVLEKSSNSITQQIRQDKGSASSISTFKIALQDAEGFLTNTLAPGVTVPDPLGRSADVYLNFEGGSFPDDSIKIYSGIVSSIDFDPGLCIIQVSHPDSLKDNDVYTQKTGELKDFTIPATGTATFALAGENVFINGLSTPFFESYMRIEDEIIRFSGGSYDSINDRTEYSIVERGALNTIPAEHEPGAEVTSFYQLFGKGPDLALRIMLSDPEREFYAELEVGLEGSDGFQQLNDFIFFTVSDLEDEYGIVPGDSYSFLDENDNEVSSGAVLLVGKNSSGSFIRVQDFGAFTIGYEPEPTSKIRFKSKYNIYPDGLGMLPKQVDISSHERFLELYATSFLEMEIYLKDTTNAKDFLEKDIYFPNSMFSVPRRGRSSCNMTLPPLAEFNTRVVNENNVVNTKSLKVSRSINRNLYSAIVYRFNEDSLEDKLLGGETVLSAESVGRIPIRTKQLVIDARGFRDGVEERHLIRRNANRFLERYRFGAEYINNVEVFFGQAFNIDVGDVVIFGSPNMKLSDSTLASRNFQPRLFEVVNRNVQIKQGKVKLDLLNTSFSLDGRYGIMAPASIFKSLSGDRMVLFNSFSTPQGENEARFKWSDYVGNDLIIRSEDFSIVEKFRLLAIDTVNPNTIVVQGITITPTEGMIVTVPDYGNGDREENALVKKLHCFQNPETEITAVVDQSEFDVDDASLFFENCVITVYESEFVEQSQDATVSEVSGNTIKLLTPLSITPVVGYKITLIGFASDEGLPYRYV